MTRLDLSDADREDQSDAIARVLRENGIGEHGDALHGWRCGHPDRYGPCSCFEDLVNELVAVVDDRVLKTQLDAARSALAAVREVRQEQLG